MTAATEPMSAEGAEYTITEVCGRALICPNGKPSLTPRLMDALLLAVAGEGDVDQAILDAETYWGITEWDRVRAMAWAGLALGDEVGRLQLGPLTRIRIAAKPFRRGNRAELSVEVNPRPIENRDPEIVAFIQAKAVKVADLEEEIAQLEAAGGHKSLRRAKLLRREVRAAQAKMKNARDIEVRRDALMGEARDPLIRAKQRGELVAVSEVETAEIARDEHGAKIINRRGPARGLPALVYSRHSRARLLGGIQHAHAQGYLDNPRSGRGGDALLQVGELYEQMVAAANPLKAVDPESSGGGGGPRGPQVRAVQASEWLKIARRDLSPRELRVLDLVCGEGHHAARAARLAGFGFQATLQALRGGLAAAATAHALAREEGGGVVARRLFVGSLVEELSR